MYLIDTSVWIDSLRQVDNAPVRFFKSLIASQARYGLTGAIYQEVLQGARTDRDFNHLRHTLGTLLFYHPRDPFVTYAEAAALYRRCRERGITVRSTLDCFIARIAIEHDLLLVHHDRDFDQLAQVCPELKCAPMDMAH